MFLYTAEKLAQSVTPKVRPANPAQTKETVMDKNADSQDSSKSYCSTEKSRCGGKRCCVGKALGALVVLGLVAGLAFCAGTRNAQARVGKLPGAALAAQASQDNIPTLKP